MRLAGDFVSDILRGLGVQECGGCKRRKAKLNAAHQRLRGSRKGCTECARAKRIGGST